MDFSRAFARIMDKQPRRIVADRFRWYVSQPLGRRVIHPFLSHAHLVRLNLENMRRRRARPSSSPGTVYVNICVDAEGPALDAFHPSWESIDDEVREVNEPAFRSAFSDSGGKPFAIDWFVVDRIGTSGNPRGLATGYHAVLDHHRPHIESARAHGYTDTIQWHYHHSPSGRVDGFNRDWSKNPLYETIICRRIAERNSFPSVYRAGNTWEDAECSRWLERFFPFDMSSRGPHTSSHYDWRRAPRRWALYNPDPDDVQRSGSQRRWMARCLDCEQTSFAVPEVEQAFLDAAGGVDSYVSFYTHDFRDMKRYITRALSIVAGVASAYDVPWRYANSLQLFRTLLSLDDGPLTVSTDVTSAGVRLWPSQNLFGEPWLACLTPGGWERLDMVRFDDNGWRASIRQDATRLVAAMNTVGGTAAIVQIR
jgi:hypothetical protein